MNCFKVIGCLALWTLPMQGQEFVSFESADFQKIGDSQLTEITLHFKVKEGFYIQSESPEIESLIATKIQIEVPTSLEVLDTSFSKEIPKNKQDFIEDTFSVILILKEEKESDSKPNIRGALAYQACSQKQCFYPRSLEFQIQ